MASGFSVFVNIGGKVDPSLAGAVAATKRQFSALGSSLSGAVNKMETKLGGLQQALAKSALSGKKAMSQINEGLSGVAGLAAAGGIAMGFKHALGDGAEIAHEEQALKNAGRTVDEVAAAMAAANRTMLELPTSTIADNLQVLNETTGAFGSVEHALDHLEFMQRAAAVVHSAAGEKVQDSAGEMGNKLARFFEMRGTAGNPKLFEEEAEQMVKAMVFTGGNFNPSEMLNFAQQAKSSLQNYSMDFLGKIVPSLVTEMGGDRAGTGANAFRSVLMGKVRDKKQVAAWEHYGLVNPAMVSDKKDSWSAGAVEGTNAALKNPLDWSEKTLLPALQKKGVDVDDPLELSKALATMFRNSSANQFAEQITQARARQRLHKDAGLIDEVHSSKQMYGDNLENDPGFALHALKLSAKNVFGSLTEPLMAPAAHMMTMFAKAINGLAKVFREHPGLAKAVGGLMSALAAYAGLKLASWALGLSGMGKSIATLAGSITVTLVQSLFGFAGGLSAAGVAAGVFSGAMRLLRGALMATGIGLLLVGIGTAAEFLANNSKNLSVAFDAFVQSFKVSMGENADKGFGKFLIESLTKIRDLFNDITRKRDKEELIQTAAEWGQYFGELAKSLSTTIDGMMPDIVSKMESSLKAGDWVGVGEAIGKAILTGISAGIANGLFGVKKTLSEVTNKDLVNAALPNAERSPDGVPILRFHWPSLSSIWNGMKNGPDGPPREAEGQAAPKTGFQFPTQNPNRAPYWPVTDSSANDRLRKINGTGSAPEPVKNNTITNSANVNVTFTGIGAKEAAAIAAAEIRKAFGKLQADQRSYLSD